jgi:hypothetical protein
VCSVVQRLAILKATYMADIMFTCMALFVADSCRILQSAPLPNTAAACNYAGLRAHNIHSYYNIPAAANVFACDRHAH